MDDIGRDKNDIEFSIMNYEKIDLIKKKYPGWFEDYVSCNLYHDPVTEQMNQYPVFAIRFYPLIASLGCKEVIQSEFTSHYCLFVDEIEKQVKKYIKYVCEKILN